MKRKPASRRTPPIEVRATRSQALGMPPARFLRDYWQKRPLLIRAAFPHFHNATTPEDLAGLACEEAALSRIVLHDSRTDRYTLKNGPFKERAFAKLPKTHWTLLVQDVDKWDMDVASLLDRFAFVPGWRVEDVMVSYATDGGGVGAHVDNYDVFLVQGRGQRRWRISDDPRAPKDFRPDADLKLLRDFAPTHDWILEPGDTLYLPPGVPHEGTALGECMTFSVGMRAPSRSELLFDYVEFLAEPLREEQRYTDADLTPAADAGEIDAAALARVRAALPQFAAIDPTTLRHWFGAFITRYRAANSAAPAGKPVTSAQLAQRLPQSVLFRNPWSRVAWAKAGRQADLFVAGERFSCTPALARSLSGTREIDGAVLLRGAGAAGLALIAELVNGGHYTLLRKRNPSARR